MAKSSPLTMQVCERFSWRGTGKWVSKKDAFHISTFKTQYFLMFMRTCESSESV